VGNTTAEITQIVIHNAIGTGAAGCIEENATWDNREFHPQGSAGASECEALAVIELMREVSIGPSSCLYDSSLGVEAGVGASETSAGVPNGTFGTLGGAVVRNNAAVHRSNGKGQESDEFELHGAREDWDGSVGGGDTRFL